MSDDLITQLLSGITGAVPASIYNMAQDDVLPEDEWPLAQRIEQAGCCALCKNRNGKVIRKDNPQYRLFLRQFHMNCKGYWAHIHKDEGHYEQGPDGQAVWVKTQPDWGEVDTKLIRKHGHFIRRPEKYSALNVPARPMGRDFVFYRGYNGEPSRLVFAAALPDGYLRQTIAHIGRVVFDRMMSAEGLVADANLAVQCAYQSAARARRDILSGLERARDPAAKFAVEDLETTWMDHYQSDRHHVKDWQESQGLILSDEQYAGLAPAILAERPDVAVMRYNARKRKHRIDTVAFRVPELDYAGAHLEDACVIWEVPTAQLWHPGRLDIPRLRKGNGFKAITGDWQ